MLKARPNQMMPSSSMNTKGRTSAASAISEPSVLTSWRAMRLMFNMRLVFGKLLIPRFARDDKS